MIDEAQDRVRTIDLGNNKIYLKQVDPFGLIYINFDKGQLPDWLKGAYTSFDLARRDVERYLNERKRGRVVTDVEAKALKDKPEVLRVED